ncbi:hypothetical protein DDI_1374 [Dickeya dianthicola RNS04.9]|nr:hypothetical protein DDI_1374 [Dickeya dianthicola RNS04.9]
MQCGFSLNDDPAFYLSFMTKTIMKCFIYVIPRYENNHFLAMQIFHINNRIIP